MSIGLGQRLPFLELTLLLCRKSPQPVLASILNTFSGGGLENYSLFAMGVSPYITAQIVVQLLQMDIVPRFVEWSKQGEVGRRKLNQWTRYLTIVLAFYTINRDYSWVQLYE